MTDEEKEMYKRFASMAPCEPDNTEKAILIAAVIGAVIITGFVLILSM